MTRMAVKLPAASRGSSFVFAELRHSHPPSPRCFGGIASPFIPVATHGAFWRRRVIGMAFIVCALAGCTDNREIKSLKNTTASLADEIAFLNTRVKAVEEACLQLNTRLMADETSDRTPNQSATAKPARRELAESDSARPAQDKIDSFSAKPELNSKPTRASFSHRVVGMTITETLAMLGKPDKVSEESGAQQWTYNELILATDGGGVEHSPALIVFEQGCVSRAVLTEKIQYSSEPKESEAPRGKPQGIIAEPSEASERAKDAIPPVGAKEGESSNAVAQTDQVQTNQVQTDQ